MTSQRTIVVICPSRHQPRLQPEKKAPNSNFRCQRVSPEAANLFLRLLVLTLVLFKYETYIEELEMFPIVAKHTLNV